MHIVPDLQRNNELWRQVVLQLPRAPPTHASGAPAPRGDAGRRGAAAAVIHSDLARGFIKAETIAWDEFVRVGGWARAREGGNVRQEGKEYLVADGDVILFKFNV